MLLTDKQTDKQTNKQTNGPENITPPNPWRSNKLGLQLSNILGVEYSTKNSID